MKYRSFQVNVTDESTGKRVIYNSYGFRVMDIPLGWTDEQIVEAIDSLIYDRNIQNQHIANPRSLHDARRR